jgi:drug/metabolite transporter (DMT)-like permease
VALHWRWGARTTVLAPGTGWAIATGILIASYSLVDKAGVARISPLAYIGLMELGATFVLGAVLARRPDALRREWRANRTAVVIAAILSPGGYLLVLFAFQLSKAAYVVAGREVSIVLSALIGSLWMGEGRLAQRLVGAALVAVGVAFVALAR